MASVAENIVANIETTLLGITVAAGYENTVARVQRVQQTLTSLADLPVLLIVPRDIRAADEEPYSVQDWVMTVEIQLVFIADPYEVAIDTDASGNPTENTTETYFAWFGDINKALLADRTRGGHALDTRIVGMEPLAVDVENRSAGIIVDAEIRYRHRYGESTVTI
jgi:hypothetical protein